MSTLLRVEKGQVVFVDIKKLEYYLPGFKFNPTYHNQNNNNDNRNTRKARSDTTNI